MAAQWLPNTNEFFFSLGRLIQNCQEQLNTASYDTSEFIIRRLDEYERTLSILLSRFTESYGHLTSQQSCLENVSYILSRTSFCRAHFERQLSLQSDEQDTHNGQSFITPSERNYTLPGRPVLALCRQQLETLHRARL